MAQAKYSAGQRVSVVRTAAFSAPSGSYRVVQALPQENGPRQYRVRHDNEPFDRILEEARLQEVAAE